ncbi:transporter, major facilitator family protein [Besnoitia besnoiti]|uniref:Transporter, major facilitator family protein n=1 Tax=Besnoitia besnoiti TaxID=94643 RepID=A0A2A9MR33_BESBE|nr:transporter, major facilitator family protein [Besnoitia besnoiti]PFH38762.1 transporter, major facilitator family protein [Besnoitia besnoiti]
MSLSEEPLPPLHYTVNQSLPPVQHGRSQVAKRICTAASMLALDKLAEIPNKTPFGLSRWVIFGIFLVYSFLTGPCYWNWTALADIFFIRDGYLWRCEAEDLDMARRIEQAKCDSQDVAVQNLFTIIVASDFSFSCLSGIILDYAGPASRVYLEHVFCFSLGVCWVVGILGASRSLSNAIPLLLRAIAINNPRLAQPLFYGYGGVCIGVCVLIAALFFPARPWQRLPSLAKVAAEGLPDTAESPEDHEEANSPLVEASVAPEESNHLFAGPLSTLGSRVLSFRSEGEEAPRVVDQLEVAVVRQDTLVTLQRGTTATAISRWSDWKMFFGEVFSLVFVPLCIYEALMLISSSFFSSAARRLIPEAYEANQIIQIFCFLPAPLLGLLADKRGILVTMVVLNGAGMLAFILAVIPEVPGAVACQYMACLCIAINSSFIISQIYCYVNQSFQEGHAGKLIGLACLVAGLPSLAANAMLSTAVNDGFLGIMFLCIGFFKLNFILIGALAVYRKQRARKVIEETQGAFFPTPGPV